MNERIKLLAEQAGATVLGTISGGKQYTFLEQDLKKFAELIVRECVDIFNDDSDNLVFEIHNKISRDKIKQHFGVE